MHLALVLVAKKNRIYVLLGFHFFPSYIFSWIFPIRFTFFMGYGHVPVLND
jgi:hypothetical protein